jgi:putative endopeptidase
MRANLFEFNRQLDKIGKPLDRTEWQMSPQTLNAYYDAQMNEIVFPAGILQPPFFDPQADDASNYGGIGMVIGHEMTHGFDDEGSKFDAQGNLKNWWSQKDLDNFKARVACIEKQFDSYTVAGGLHLKGKLVAGESASDLGGMMIAYRALEKALAGKPRTRDANGFTPEQRFFISFAQVWAANIRPEQERKQAMTDPHPINRFRVNGTLMNMSEFGAAFGCREGEPVMRTADDRCVVW